MNESLAGTLNPEASENPPPENPRRPPCPIVGIGASAGGVQALQKFLPAVPADSGLAFVVVLHLSPEHESALAQILARISPIPVIPISDGMAVEPNHAYVIPPDAILSIQGGSLHLAPLREKHATTTTIDSFLDALARDQAENAACVILSGTGSDGTIGLRAIKENGGLTLAQAHAEYDGMMQSALATGLVDLVLPAEEIPAKLVAYFRHLEKLVARKKDAEGSGREVTAHLKQICAVLRTRTGHDFSGYKDKTLIRRVQRRMQVLQIDEVPVFLDRLRKDAREVDLLFHDLLIGVTSFFRNPEAFEALEKTVIPHLFEGKGADDTVRVWVPGCSTGEEAYTLAMLLREHAEKGFGAPKLQIFASDIDEHALEVARLGRYPAAIERDVPPRLLERYFVHEDGTYRVAGELRTLCLFAQHDLLRDAPFSRLDLISCRNLLIYLGPELQSRVIPLFHYALCESGYLFLGTAENVTRHSRLFSSIDRAHRIFRRFPQAERKLPEFPLTTPETNWLGSIHPLRPPVNGLSLQGLAERQLLERYAPTYVVINAEGELLYASAGTGKYLELPAGAPSTNLFAMARREFRFDLRAAIHEVGVHTERVARRNIVIGADSGRVRIELAVQPLSHDSAQDAVYMVIFQDHGAVEPAPERGAPPSGEDREAANCRQLEAELLTTRERLQTTTEELESANEELKSRNEELSSMNEELQSTNEELETSKEELQSINEELQTLNAELQSRVDELGRANSDIANLLESTQIAAVFLDRNLRVTSFTPAAKDVFHLVTSDSGRLLAHVRARFRLDTVEEDARRVLRSLSTIERQIEGDNGARYIMRILPYRTVDNVITGIVITFSDVTRLMAAEIRIDELTRDLRNRVESLETLLDVVPVGILISEDGGAGQVMINRHGARLLASAEEGRGLRRVAVPIRLLVDGRELPVEEHPLQRAVRLGEPTENFEGALLRPDGSSLYVMISATPLFDEHGHPRGAIAAIADISRIKAAEADRDVLLHELQHRVKNILASVGSLAARMLKNGGSMEGFSTAFLARLKAMGDLQDLLSARSWQGADLRSLVATALAPYAGPGMSNVTLDGPALALRPSAVGSLGLVLHELATNAAKYGALSAAGGRIGVSWGSTGDQGDPQLVLSWAEHNESSLKGMGEEGFGLKFIKRCVEYELDGKAGVTLAPDGLRCRIEFPLREAAVEVPGDVTGREESDGGPHPGGEGSQNPGG